MTESLTQHRCRHTLEPQNGESKQKMYRRRYMEKNREYYNEYMRNYMKGKRYDTPESRKRNRDLVKTKYGSYTNYKRFLKEEKVYREWAFSFGF